MTTPNDLLADAVAYHTRMAEVFDGRYAYDERFKSRHAVWNELIAAHSGPTQAVLDVGCGSGALSFFAASRNRYVFGIDGSEAMIRLAEAKSADAGVQNVSFAVGRLENLASFVVEPCDLLLCSSVLEYVDDLDAALTGLVSVVRPGGAAILSMPNRQSLYRRTEPLLYRATGRPEYFQYVRNVLSLGELTERLARQHCRLLDARYYGALPVVSPVCRRLGHPEWSETLFAAVFRLP